MASNAACSASLASTGVERRVSSVPPPMPAWCSKVTVVAWNRGHAPGNGASAGWPAASANDERNARRRGGSISVNRHRPWASGKSGPEKL
jgi:hypothetical protein